ncbi:MAG: nicotinate-nucleotide--dimethylbenzimidazole phosphoribosyltransferase [Chloroflexi bacterium]|nr:nicotinate-nucleotide--dimethylbenzimidazole phosphoribosyltransferase [Chloroflexota bacterium]
MTSLHQIIKHIGPLDEGAMKAARARQDTLTKPLGSLGTLEALSVKLAGITGKPLPRIKDKVIVTIAGDHGVVEQGVSLYPQEVTAQMVYNFLAGGAGINVLGRLVGARIIVVDAGVKAELGHREGLISRRIAAGTADMTKGPAMSRDQAIAAIEIGISTLENELQRGVDIVGTGDMGIGNTTPSSAICAVVTGQPVAQVTGRGTGVGDEQLALKAQVIQRAIEVNKPESHDALDILSKVGGFEIGGIAGVILASAAHHIPVVIDGFISGAGALIATGLSPLVREYIIPAHLSVEPGHRAMMNYLKAKPLLDLDLRLGEGTGACLGMFLVEAAARTLSEMATFDEAGVSKAEED